MSDKAILQRFEEWRCAGRPLVLATVVETAGSTYTKAGHRILIADNGDYQGLVSGGCLEGDVAEHAQQVLATGEARVVTYDLRGEDDELFGLGIGCDGLLRILLQRLNPVDDYAPFAALAAVLRGDAEVMCAVALDTGTTWFDADRVGPLPRIEAIDREGQTTDVLFTRLRPLPRLLVLGAGLDAVPVITLADSLGWRVTVADHRPAYLERGDLASAETRVCAPVEELASRMLLARFAAAIVMSHHLASDRGYLRALAASAIPYVGLLGPAGRRERLLLELGPDAASLTGRLHGPAGLDIGADSPESIALSIIAEIIRENRGRSGTR